MGERGLIMKVLFAINNDNISDAIVKKYQQIYREILSYKNVYYFNAILKELQKDKTYDRVVISEDLEPFANNNYDTIDKFLFEKLDNISDEATDESGENTDIILICSDRRDVSDDMLIKFFGIGIYSAVIGKDRSIDEIIRLINKPRTKKEAKQYYRIEADNVSYQSENEDNVSEAEVQNILAHYKRLGKNEDKYVDSFNNIVSQYTDNQLKIIIRYLPMNVKAVLEERSPKYQELVTFDKDKKDVKYMGKFNNAKGKYEPYKPNKVDKPDNNAYGINVLEKQLTEDANRPTKPVVIPSGISNTGVRKLIKEEKENVEVTISRPQDNEGSINHASIDDILGELENNENDELLDTPIEEVKRGRGRPKKAVPTQIQAVEGPKRGRGRPKKAETNIEPESNEQEGPVNLFGLDDEEDEDNIRTEPVPVQTNQQAQEDSVNLFGLDDDDDSDESLGQALPEEEVEQRPDPIMLTDNDELEESIDSYSEANMPLKTNYSENNANFSNLYTKDKKIVAFVGTTKNGTSFIVNNTAEFLASSGISTAILDMTKSKNAYYIYTKNEENLRQTAADSIYKLKNGSADGIRVNKNLTVYTGLPGEDKDYSDVQSIISTLIKNYSLVLIDCDFNTDVGYFDAANEIYLIQSMDVLTIQPLTAFLRNLKSKNVLKQEKVKIVVNKEQKLRSLSIKTLIGGMAFYNDPAMSYMTELFDKDKTPYAIVPFELQTYDKYLEALVNCEINLNGYSKAFMGSLQELANMVYPLINRKEYSPRGDRYKDNFTNEMNSTLSKMKQKR